jgi:acylphosphatase
MHERVLELHIHGRVQGVGYRAALFAQAQRLGVRGWVRNRRDGTVQAVLAGTGDAVQRVLEWARHGPPSAAVERIEVQPAAGEFTGFELRPTG